MGILGVQESVLTPTIHFVAGLPRSGSTLLLNLLGQNPAHHVTPTNGLLWMMAILRDNWSSNDAFVAQGLQVIEPRISAALRGMAYGFYEQELGAKHQVVFDKNRAWMTQIELLERVFNRRVPVIVTVRDVKAIVASFEKLYRKNPVARRQYLGPAYIQAQTIDGRARVLMSPGGVIGMPVNALRDALNRGVSDRLLIVPYGKITVNPQETLASIHHQLGLPSFFDYDPNNVQQITKEDDAVHGWGYDLHTIRPKVEPPKSPPWEGILPPHTCKWLDEEFADINHLSNGKPGEADKG
jgi:sulfotransferase